MTDDLARQVGILLRARHVQEALALVEASPAESAAWFGLKRRCLARLGRLEEAVVAGRGALSLPGAVAEDYFRQGQILARTGRYGEAAEVILAALALDRQTRFLAPLVEAVLMDASLRPVVLSGLQRLAPQVEAAMGGTGDRVFVPNLMPFYDRYANDHPWIRGLVSACPGIDFKMPAPDDGAPGRVAAALDFAQVRFADLTRHPKITPEAAAEFIGARFESLLWPQPDCGLDLLNMGPETLGQRPWVLLYDYLPVMFQPFYAYEETVVGPDDPFYWIVRHELESDACRGIMTTYESSAEQLDRFFGSPAINAKITYINSCHSADELDAGVEERPNRRADGEVVMLFASSFSATDERFIHRGGIDALNAFEALAEERTNVRLLFRAPLPCSASERLQRLVRSHPRIEWYPERMEWNDYRQLFERSILFLLPGTTAYRNGLVQAMSWGLVPVGTDGPHMADLIEDGRTGVLVPGRAGLSGLDGQVFRQHWTPILRATDRPADAAFNRRYVEALRDLVDAPPERLRAMSEAARAASLAYQSDAANIGRFRSVIERALAASA